MRCKKHITDLSSTIGVCASCLRDRLFVIIAAQAQEDSRRTDHSNSSPPVFPRSVSPYISRRKSDGCSLETWHLEQGIHDQRFFSTPHVGPNGNIVVSICKKKSGLGFPLFANLFSSKSDNLDPGISDSDPGLTGAVGSCTGSGSWFASVLLGRRTKKTTKVSVDDPVVGGQRRACRIAGKGMSPDSHSDVEDDHRNLELWGSLSECSKQWKETPRRTPAWVAPGKRGGLSRNASGFGLCLSPMVRASPSRHWNQKGIPPEMVVAGDIRVVPVKPSPSHPAAFSKSRSRKMADFGRCHLNR